jgi:hypothetical protein
VGITLGVWGFTPSHFPTLSEACDVTLGLSFGPHPCNPTFGRMWGWHSHSRNGDLGVLRDFQNFRCRLQGSKHLALRRLSWHWKLLKCRCRKWPCMSHLDICSTSYGKKKGRKSNWQFDSQPLKVGNRPNPGVCRWSATHHWKTLNESDKFALDFNPIWGLSKKLWTHNVPRVQIGTISGLLLGSPKTKNHLDVGVVE